MAITDRGFASMDPAKQKAIASLGGKAAHRMGRAHQWDAEAARIAGRKHRGRRFSDEHRRKLSVAQQARWARVRRVLEEERKAT